MNSSNIRSLGALAFTGVTALLLAPVANAQSATPTADQRQANQAARINQGVASGELTNREAARLRHGQAHVQNVENRVKADGVVTPKEGARLNHAQNVQSERIARQKHDRQHDRNHDGKMDHRKP